METKDVDVLHHLGLISRNMDSTIDAYERLGFVFAPLTLPQIPLSKGSAPQPIGVGNRCAIFENNYLEVLAVVDPTLWGSITSEQRGPFNIDLPLKRYEGLHVLHLGTDDLESVRTRLVANGLTPTSIRPFQRVIDTEHGPRTMRAKSLSFPHGSNPEALLQIAQHETPELVLQPRYMNHPNGARSITEVFICTDEVEELTAKYERYSGKRADGCNGIRTINLGLSRIFLSSPTDVHRVLPNLEIPTLPFLAGFTVRADLARTRQVLEQREVCFSLSNDRIIVSPKDAYGCAVVFEAEGARL